MNKLIVLCVIFLLISCNCYSQSERVYLNIKLDKSENSNLKNILRVEGKYKNRLEAISVLNRKIAKLREKGFWEANIDSVVFVHDSIHTNVHLGSKYSIEKFSSADLNKKNLSEFNYRVNHNDDLNKTKLHQKSMLKELNNNGYPFALIELDSLNIDNKILSGVWKLNCGERVYWDTIIRKGDLKIKKNFIERYLSISSGKLYSEKRFNSISDKIKGLNFVREIKPAEVEFIKNKALLYTYLSKEKSNRFDGILGLLNNSGSNNKLELTGEINLFLENTLKVGEQIKLNWKKYEAASQNLNVGFGYPYLIGNIGFDFDLGIEKKDSTYLTSDLNLGVRLFQRGTKMVRLFYKFKSSALLSTKNLSGISVLPDYADVKSNLIGLGVEYSKLDYSYNPKSGYAFDFNFAIGKHTTEKNSKIPQELYENLDLKGTLINAEWYWEYNIPLAKKISYRIKNKGGIISSPDLFANDLFKLGGISSLRGFNENIFLASEYTVLSNELRFIPERNTSFYLFWDGAYYKNEILDKKSEDLPWGIGLGFNFGTRSGIFSLTYALGKQKNQNLDFKTAKIHFGFVSRF
nr:BamA/TamA family outer membrane protein [uncultured Marinifilum sp.]